MSENKESLQVILGEGASFEGVLRFKGQVRLGGNLKGEISGEGCLIIESTAKVNATILTDHLILLGECKGKIKARKSVVMEVPAHFSGDISSPALAIKEGVFFEGTSKKGI
ncbi:MAG: polymer-forming cytoskeletal protein [Bdellovibrionales bacterium]|nr:polymer-forming cytoskeletal protein [Bdellovibrionales bacterium]